MNTIVAGPITVSQSYMTITSGGWTPENSIMPSLVVIVGPRAVVAHYYKLGWFRFVFRQIRDGLSEAAALADYV